MGNLGLHLSAVKQKILKDKTVSCPDDQISYLHIGLHHHQGVDSQYHRHSGILHRYFHPHTHSHLEKKRTQPTVKAVQKKLLQKQQKTLMMHSVTIAHNYIYIIMQALAHTH